MNDVEHMQLSDVVGLCRAPQCVLRCEGTWESRRSRRERHELLNLAIS